VSEAVLRWNQKGEVHEVSSYAFPLSLPKTNWSWELDGSSCVTEHSGTSILCSGRGLGLVAQLAFSFL
jgi:hypothetical protein